MDVKKLFILILSALIVRQAKAFEVNCNNKTFVCYDEELYYPCIQVGDNKSEVVSDLQRCPVGLECDDNADTACQEVRLVENNVSDEDHPRNSEETTEKMSSMPSEIEAIITSTLQFDMPEIFTHDTTAATDIQTDAEPYDVLTSNVPTDYAETDSTSTTNIETTQYARPFTYTTESVEVDDEKGFRSTEGVDNEAIDTILDNNKVSRNNSKVSDHLGLDDRNFQVGEEDGLIPSFREDRGDYAIESTTNLNDVTYTFDISSADYDINTTTTTLQPAITESASDENEISINVTFDPIASVDPTEPITDDEARREAKEIEQFFKLIQQLAPSSTEISTENLTDVTEIAIQYTTQVVSEMEHTTIPIAINQKEIEEILDKMQDNVESTMDSLITTTELNQTPFNVTFDPITTVDATESREAEELEQFFKLAQQVTPGLIEAVSDGEKFGISDETEAGTLRVTGTTEVSDTATEFGHTTIENDRFERESGEDQFLFEEPILSNDSINSIDESSTKPNLENMAVASEKNALERESEEDEYGHQTQATFSPINALSNAEDDLGSAVDIGTEYKGSTLSSSQQFEFGNDSDSVGSTLEPVADTNAMGIEILNENVTLEQSSVDDSTKLADAKDRLQRESEESLDKIQDPNDKIAYSAIEASSTTNLKTGPNTINNRDESSTKSSFENMAVASENNVVERVSEEDEYAHQMQATFSPINGLSNAEDDLDSAANVGTEYEGATLSSNQQFEFGTDGDSVGTTLEPVADTNAVGIEILNENVTLEQSPVADLTKLADAHDRLQRESEESLDKIQDPNDKIAYSVIEASSTTNFKTRSTTSNNRDESSTKSSFENMVVASESNVVERESEEDEYAHQTQATFSPINALSNVEDDLDSAVNIGTEYKGSTLSSNQQFQFGTDSDSVGSTLEPVPDTYAVGIQILNENLTLEQSPIDDSTKLTDANDRFQRESEESLDKIQDPNDKIAYSVIEASSTTNFKTGPNTSNNRDETSTKPNSDNVAILSVNNVLGRESEENEYGHQTQPTFSPINALINAEDDLDSAANVATEYKGATLSSTQQFGIGTNSDSLGILNENVTLEQSTKSADANEMLQREFEENSDKFPKNPSDNNEVSNAKDEGINLEQLAIPIASTIRPIISSDRFQKESDDNITKIQINQNFKNENAVTNLEVNSTAIPDCNPLTVALTTERSKVSFVTALNAMSNKDAIKKDLNKNPEETEHNLESSFVCKMGGKFPDPKNCSVYHRCIDIYIQILHFPSVCPPGTLYDRNLQSCTRRPVECSEDNTLQCTTSGVFAHPTDCNRYYKCFWRSLHKKFSLWQFKCPPRMRYDQERRKCVNAAATTLDCSGLSQDSTESPFYCMENGRFPMEYNCDGYYDCKEKKGAFQTKAKFCSQGKLFDAELGRCRRSDLVFCPYEYDNSVEMD